MDRWKCKRCNFVFESEKPPKVCPKCGHEADFELFVNETLYYDE